MADRETLSTIADELVEQAVLTLDQEAIVFTEENGKLVVHDKYQELWNRVYDILENNLNGEN